MVFAQYLEIEFRDLRLVLSRWITFICNKRLFPHLYMRSCLRQFFDLYPKKWSKKFVYIRQMITIVHIIVYDKGKQPLEIFAFMIKKSSLFEALWF